MYEYKDKIFLSYPSCLCVLLSFFPVWFWFLLSLRCVALRWVPVALPIPSGVLDLRPPPCLLRRTYACIFTHYLPIYYKNYYFYYYLYHHHYHHPSSPIPPLPLPQLYGHSTRGRYLPFFCILTRITINTLRTLVFFFSYCASIHSHLSLSLLVTPSLSISVHIHTSYLHHLT